MNVIKRGNGKYMKIHHIGYLVKRMKEAILEFEKLGFVITKNVIFDEYRQIEFCFLEKNSYTIELVCPCSKDSVATGLLLKMGNTPYHVCYEVENFDDAVSDFQKKGYLLVNPRHEAVAMDGREVCFLVNPYIGMIELVEENKN